MASRSLGSMVLVGRSGHSVCQGTCTRQWHAAGRNPRDVAERRPGKGSSAENNSDSPRDKSASTSTQPKPKLKNELAAFGAGCFWHVEDVFERLDGVKSAVSGYAGGNVPYPTYEMVHEGTTGHAETVVVQYDPNVISYEQLLKVFWANHDPTSLNRQGPDVGPQYRSVIFYYNEDQRKAALASYHDLTRARVYRSPIVTELVPMRAFFQAEDYHQDYYGGKPRASQSPPEDKHCQDQEKHKRKYQNPPLRQRNRPATRPSHATSPKP